MSRRLPEARHRLWALGLTALVGLSVACARSAAPAAPAPIERSGRSAPILLLAVDGLEWSVLGPLVARGMLPNLANLIERGSSGRLRSMLPTYSPVIWTTIATGKPPAEHGIENITFQPGPQASSPKQARVYTSGHRRTKAFWNILSEAGRSVGVIGWWITWPAEPVRGVLVSQTNTTAVLHARPGTALWKGSLLAGVERQVFPPDREPGVLELLASAEARMDALIPARFGQPPGPLGALEQRLWAETRWSLRGDEVYLRCAEAFLEGGDQFDLLAVYFGAPDVIGHRFWRYARPGEFEHPPAPEQIANFGRTLDDSYRFVDMALGRLLERWPKQAGVLVISDHGMHAVNQERAFRAEDPPPLANSGNHLDAPAGVWISAGGPFARAEPPRTAEGRLDWESMPELGGVLDVLPTLLTALDLPPGEDMPGLVQEALLDADWRAAHHQRRVPTHDSEAWRRAQATRTQSAADESERMEQLRALGYIK